MLPFSSSDRVNMGKQHYGFGTECVGPSVLATHHTTPASFDILKLRIIRAERRLPPRIEVPFQGFELPIPHL